MPLFALFSHLSDSHRQFSAERYAAELGGWVSLFFFVPRNTIYIIGALRTEEVSH